MSRPLCEEERLLLGEIRIYKGFEDPVKVKVLAERARLSERSVRQIVSDLVNEHGQPIGSSTHGYFIIETEADIKIAIAHLTKQITPLAKRIENLKEIVNKDVDRQMSLGEM